MNVKKRDTLLRKGVQIPNPESIEIGQEVDVDRISGNGVVIHAGCRIFGADTLILQGARIGHQAPATVDNCFIGPEVHLDGGYFRNAVFLKGANMGPGAQVREGTILEEGAGGAHTVGLKQTILFPFATLGSLINFCDCFMSGGTSRKDHSEVGSSYIHFNYTPNQDKATPSLLGDVAQGVMLDQRPIFLGGQGGLVGPCRLAFGTVTAAGTICRKDELRPGRLIFGGRGQGGSVAYVPGGIRNITRVIRNNIVYIANLAALLQWYRRVRILFISNDFPDFLHAGLERTLRINIEERVKQLGRYVDIVAADPKAVSPQRRELTERWPELVEFLRKRMDKEGDQGLCDTFLKALESAVDSNGKDYIFVIKSLNILDKGNGTRWLESIVDGAVSGIYRLLPSFE